MKNTWSEKGKVKMALITRRPQIPAYPDQMNNHHPCITNKLKLNTLGQKKSENCINNNNKEKPNTGLSGPDEQSISLHYKRE